MSLRYKNLSSNTISINKGKELRTFSYQKKNTKNLMREREPFTFCCGKNVL
jgi:hypothetical protein